MFHVQLNDACLLLHGINYEVKQKYNERQQRCFLGYSIENEFGVFFGFRNSVLRIAIDPRAYFWG